ncbi:Hsp33 family molecular chaperone HslO [Amphiplicatus metriothermophilus]|uniref:Molecular chaperone Hsp33 n=1 Tax=Amphiplicatus metriothermophilus TaxID=1519374 RepID=A0A239PJS6_9PROT|nr:Hsp33 family molecular chaperone HslO [Amphiplicatus metriothermophilus]MBB5517769.1 molecular chaperone Hsp33 [Amphiplicatus metriothermophilus]SNT67897.1 molecular chaperone Hsp33 [Amphiplicatus metriothermophilus]
MAENGRTDAREDRILPFQLESGPVRGRVVRLGSAIDRILRPHPFSTPVKELVGEAAALAAMMGASLKFSGRLTLQAQGDGPVPLLVADYWTDGRLRATARVAHAPAPDARGLGALVGRGHLAFTIDQGPDMDRYQGVAPIEGDSLAAAAAGYFARSEQIPTALSLVAGRVQRPGEGEVWRAGGVMAQLMPGGEGDRDLWARAGALLETTQADELLDPDLSPERLLYRLFHEEGVRAFEAKDVRAWCGCDAGRIAAVLARYDEAALAGMVEDGFIRAACDFCRTEYLFDRHGREVAA